METHFPKLLATLIGQPSPPKGDGLEAALAEQVRRGGRGSEIAAAKLKGLRAAELRGSR